MSRELRRVPSSVDDPDVTRRRTPVPPEHGLLALQRGAGNRAVARLVLADNVLNAPRTWLDLKAGSKTLRELWKERDSKLIDHLSKSLPQPGLKGIQEADRKTLERQVLFEAPWDDPDQRTAYIDWVEQQLKEHGSLVELVGIDKLNRPAPRPIMRPGDLVPEPDDLAGLSDSKLMKKWCVLIAIVFSEGKDAVRAELETAGMPKAKLPKPDASDAAYYKAMHDFYYGTKRILYDDTASKPPVLAAYNYRLHFAGPTTFPQLWKAGLKNGDRLIIDIEGHTMYVTVQADFDKEEDAKKPLSSVFKLHNVKENWNWQDQNTFGRKVLYVYKRG